MTVLGMHNCYYGEICTPKDAINDNLKLEVLSIGPPEIAHVKLLAVKSIAA